MKIHWSQIYNEGWKIQQPTTISKVLFFIVVSHNSQFDWKQNEKNDI